MREKLLKVRFPVRFSGLSHDFPRMTQLIKTRTTGRFLKKRLQAQHHPVLHRLPLLKNLSVQSQKASAIPKRDCRCLFSDYGYLRNVIIALILKPSIAVATAPSAHPAAAATRRFGHFSNTQSFPKPRRNVHRSSVG